MTPLFRLQATHIQECEWFRIYDIIEGIYGLLHQKGMHNPFASTDTALFVNEKDSLIAGE